VGNDAVPRLHGTITIAYARLAQRNLSDRFPAMHLGTFLPELRNRNVEPNTCMDDVTNVVEGSRVHPMTLGP
jgi:hypothetical protein